MEREWNLKFEQLMREKKLTETEARARIATTESDFIDRLDEAKKNGEHERRKLIAFVLDQFRGFFNRKGAIDEESFKEVILTVKSEFHRLKRSDDRIRTAIRATSGQTTDDAVAFMLNRS
jgi:hypothetical protein